MQFASLRPTFASGFLRAPLSKAIALIVLSGLILLHTASGQTALAVLNPGVQASEEAPFASSGYTFLPGEFVYFTFQIAGFTAKSAGGGEARKISLKYEVSAQDAAGRLLTKPVADEIDAELNPEDKDWTPKRHAMFQIPAFVAAGEFHIHVSVQDLVAKAEASSDTPFHIGGVAVQQTAELSVQNFAFFRNPDERKPLELPAYSPGDHVYARFDMTGYKLGEGNEHHLAYGILVERPDGKPYLNEPNAAELRDQRFYPAQFVPGNLNLATSSNSSRGEYTIILTVRDLVGKQQVQFKRAFSIE